MVIDITFLPHQETLLSILVLLTLNIWFLLAVVTLVMDTMEEVEQEV
jgi:hypothetical protein